MRKGTREETAKRQPALTVNTQSGGDVCAFYAREIFFFLPPQSGRDDDLLNSAAGTVARNFHGAERVAPI